MTWMVTGGAGYIGAHVVGALASAGESVVVLDDFSTGRRTRLPAGIPVIEGSLLDPTLVRRSMAEHAVHGVIHLAAKKAVADSMARPLEYYRENVGGCQVLLEAMTALGVERLVLSSSAAVYGSPVGGLVAEDSPLRPISPYGASKLVCEWMVRDVGRAHALQWIALRYFNVAGSAAPDLADRGDSNLIPMVFRAIEEDRRPQIFGDDYETPDGSCVRDFIHVQDLAEAHVSAARQLTAAGHDPCARVYNVGRGQGVSVKEVVDVIGSVTGRPVRAEVVARRDGDPPSVVGDVRAIRHDLGWRPRRVLHDMVSSAWAGRTAGGDDASTERYGARSRRQGR